MKIQYRNSLLVGTTLALAIATYFLPVISQDLSYHGFVDQRQWLSIPHFLNVISNLPISIVGLLGFIQSRRYAAMLPPGLTRIWQIFFTAIFFVGLCSTYYHLDPNNETLVWDRLPIAIGMTTLLVSLIYERINPRIATIIYLPLLIVAVFSVFFWIYTEQNSIGDLRPYIFVQYGSMLLIFLILIIYKVSWRGHHNIFYGFTSYAFSKLFEIYDKPVYALTDKLISGHTLKHFWVAIGAYFIYRYYIKLSESCNEESYSLEGK